MAIRYLGSKARVATAIMGIVGPPTETGVFVDAFAGTGAVAAAAADEGWAVKINDALISATILARARILAASDVPFEEFGGYAAVVAELNAMSGHQGFVTESYSPISRTSGETERKYFTVDNARKLDTWRQAIADLWGAGRLTPEERDLLIADVLYAANASANTAGTYGSYLKDWSSAALRPAALIARELRSVAAPHEAHVGPAEALHVDEADTVYLDPPYTKRQYAAYYHVLETIALGDRPTLSGSTGLRPWKHLASDFSYQSRALQSIINIMSRLPAGRLLLSYSNQGHANIDDLVEGLSGLGEVDLIALGSLVRYTPNAAAVGDGTRVEEYIIEVIKHPVTAGLDSHEVLTR